MVEERGIEPRNDPCKGPVLPLALYPHVCSLRDSNPYNSGFKPGASAGWAKRAWWGRTYLTVFGPPQIGCLGQSGPIVLRWSV
jgi:hypothetical protein